MKLLIRYTVIFILGFGLSGALSLAFTSQSIILASAPPSNSTEIANYPKNSPRFSIVLKWPRGSLIFPEVNDPQKANEVFLLNETLTSKPELQSLHYHLGLQFFSRSKYDEAKREYLKALEFKPDIPAIYKNLGLIYFNSKHYKRAERAYRKALQLDPGYTTALAKLALSLAAQKKYSSAERKFKQAIRAEPSNADHYLNLGHFYFYLKKDYKGAKRSYKKALKYNPRLAKARRNLKDINRKFRKSKNRESDFENSWGSDFDYNSTKNKNNSQSAPGYPEEADIAGTWDEDNSQRPLF